MNDKLEEIFENTIPHGTFLVRWSGKENRRPREGQFL